MEIGNKQIYRSIRVVLILFLCAILDSCSSDLVDHSFKDMDNRLVLGVSEDNLVLNQADAAEEINFFWTTGTNEGTNKSISYALELSIKDGKPNQSLEYLQGTRTYQFSLKTKTLNQILLETFNVLPGEEVEMTAKIQAFVGDEENTQQEDALHFMITPYQPVSETLYIIGSASPEGWSADNAIELIKTGEGTFMYKGILRPGEFKFITDLGSFLPSYNLGSDENTLFYRTTEEAPDDLMAVDKNSEYSIEVNLLDETFNIVEGEIAPPFSELWLVGDATESGWDVDNPAATFIQNDEDPFIFEYEGELNPGEMKIFAGPLGDFCGDWYRPLIDGQSLSNADAEQNSGCDKDNKWRVTEETAGKYKITVDTKDEEIIITSLND